MKIKTRKKRALKKRVKVEFLSTGCTELDSKISDGKTRGGVPRGRIINIIGDGSSGKTLLAIEICAWCYYMIMKIASKIWPKVKKVIMVYNNVEGVMDFPLEKMYGKEFVKAVIWIRKKTVEAFGRDLKRRLRALKKGEFLIYIVDSWDGLKSEAEQEQFESEAEKDVSESGGYNLSKQQYTHRFFRNIADELYGEKVAEAIEDEAELDESLFNNKDATLIILSQTKYKIGASKFEKQKYRTGGSALDFWTHLCLWLYKGAKEKRERKKKKIIVGRNTRAVVERSKVAKPYGEANFPIFFDYGIDDITSMVNYLYGGSKKTYKMDDQIFKTKEAFVEYIDQNRLQKRLRKETRALYLEIEELARPVRRRKYS